MATDFRSWAARQQAPFTVALVVSLVGSALVGWLTQGASTKTLMMLGPSQPWGFITYPWAYSPSVSPFGLLFLVFFMMWILRFGGEVERDMSTLRFIGFWLTFTLLPAFVALAMRFPLDDPWLPSTAVVVAWCARNRGASLCFWGISISAAVLAAFLSASVLLTYGLGNPLVGVLMALPLALAWAFGGDKTPVRFSGAVARRRKESVVKGGTRYDDAYYENVKKREIEREEQERLRRLFEGD